MNTYFNVLENTTFSDLEVTIMTDIFGYLSGTLGAIRLIPQVIKVFKTKSTMDLSYFYLSLALSTAFFRLIYGIMIGSLPIVITSPIIGINVLIILGAKCVFDKKNKNKFIKDENVL
jgi:Uncharacterized conserved protein